MINFRLSTPNSRFPKFRRLTILTTTVFIFFFTFILATPQPTFAQSGYVDIHLPSDPGCGCQPATASTCEFFVDTNNVTADTCNTPGEPAATCHCDGNPSDSSCDPETDLGCCDPLLFNLIPPQPDDGWCLYDTAPTPTYTPAPTPTGGAGCIVNGGACVVTDVCCDGDNGEEYYCTGNPGTCELPDPTSAPPSNCDWIPAGCNAGYPAECGETLDQTSLCCSDLSDCPASAPGLTPFPTPTPAPLADYDPCDGVENQVSCRNCLAPNDPDYGFAGSWTAFGCFPTDPGPFAAKVIEILFGIAGGVAFLLMLYGAFLCITSQGNPQKAQACKETVTSAIIGIIMLIFSLFIIRILFAPYIGILPNLVPGNIF